MLLDVRNLKTHFTLASGQVAEAVEGINFGVDQGETLALVGESGCGKSVTALSVMRLLAENATHPVGEILFEGQDLIAASDRTMQKIRGNRMAMIFQEPMTSLNPLMRIDKQLMEPLTVHRGMSTEDALNEARQLLRHVGIPSPEARLKDFPYQLSGGMRQRVMIAMALACRPRLLIADEPTTALDVTIQAQILSLMKDLQQETNMAILFITHDLGVVNQIADKVCVMYAGRFMETGPRESIFSHMAHPYTRGLFASLPALHSQNARLRAIPGTVPSATAYPCGCPFNDRCREAFKRCPAEESLLHPVGKEQYAACHLLEPNADCQRDEQAWEPQEDRPSNPERDAENLLEVRNLKAHFPVKRGVFLRTVAHVKAVDDITFDVPRGSTLALVGESGCGKTTVGLSILRLLSEAEGTVVFDAEDMMAWDKKQLRLNRRKLQLVFQDPFSSLSPRMTVGAIVAEGIRIHYPRINDEDRLKRVVKSLREVGLDESALGRYPHEFSGGQRQRISIARALVLQPDFMVLDEPTSALDVSVQAQILNLLVDLQAKHNLTYLFITHDLAVVRYMAEKVAVMYLGRIVECAACDELFDNPLHPYTKSLLQAIPRPDERRELMRLRGEVPSPLTPPKGCHFHPRCPVYGAAPPDSLLRAECPNVYPPLLDYDGHFAACYEVQHEEERRTTQATNR
ncbi:MAG: dipeptide ABC transporter ATP-binding protein [Candidatus Pacebacteria bacterium]|nr:dipeptide ABC transporter ATP-binding protein [Candidatus Paceibacterota bacterium]